MTDETREQIRDNARYLRSVRPIDPDEIFEYVEGQPHPGVVRQILREEAVDLGLLEQDDGTFVPAPEGPITVPFHGVEWFPSAYERVVDDLLTDAYGPDWEHGESGDRLRERIRDVKERYLHGTDVEYDDLTAHGYAIYHLPDYYAAAQYLLADLAADGLLPSQLRVLDVGAGVGGPAMGLVDLLPDDALLSYHAVEPSAAADVLETLLETTGSNVQWSVHRERAEGFDPEGEYDLVLFSNVLSELADPVAVVQRYLSALAPDGTLLAMAPADKNTATDLRTVERAVADEGPATVYAPTVRLWPHLTPESDSWSFDRKPDIEVPDLQRRLDDAGPGEGEFVNVDVQYAFSVLRTDGRTRIELTPDRGTHAPMADAESYVTGRVNLLAIKLSHDLSDGEHANPLYLLGDGSQAVDHFAVVTEPSLLNDDLQAADYGDLLSLQNALVLWNDDKGAYNVVIDGETTVDRAR